jgi:hypothetical protein
MDRDREYLLGVVLTDDIVVEDLADLLRGRNLVARFRQRGLVLLADDVHAKLDAFVTNEDGRPGNELAHLVLALAAEGAAGSSNRRRQSCSFQSPDKMRVVPVATPAGETKRGHDSTP